MDLPPDLEKGEGCETICPFCDSYIICRMMPDGRLSWRNENNTNHLVFQKGRFECHPYAGPGDAGDTYFARFPTKPHAGFGAKNRGKSVPT